MPSGRFGLSHTYHPDKLSGRSEEEEEEAARQFLALSGKRCLGASGHARNAPCVPRDDRDGCVGPTRWTPQDFKNFWGGNGARRRAPAPTMIVPKSGSSFPPHHQKRRGQQRQAPKSAPGEGATWPMRRPRVERHHAHAAPSIRRGATQLSAKPPHLRLASKQKGLQA